MRTITQEAVARLATPLRRATAAGLTVGEGQTDQLWLNWPCTREHVCVCRWEEGGRKSFRDCGRLVSASSSTRLS